MTTAARADREVIRAAAAAIRHIAAQDQYRNGQYPTAAFNMALVLDELALHATSLPDDLRAAVAAACRRIIKDGGRLASGLGR